MTDNNIHDVATIEGLEQAIEQATSTVTETQRKRAVQPSLDDAQRAREDFKQHIKTAFAQATRERDYAIKAIDEIEKAVAMHRVTRDGLQTMLDDANGRIRSARIAMAALQGEVD